MLALVKYAEGPGNMEIRDLPEPSPGPGQVKIAVKFTGICGSDLHVYDSDIKIPTRLPVVTGHEFSGVVAETGSGVKRFKIGDRVTAETTYETCGTCRHCRSGNYNLCLNRRGIAYWYNGAFTEYVVVPAEKTYALPEAVSFEEGAVTEPLACALNGTLLAVNIKAGDRVLVSGPGVIGLLALQLAIAQGGIVTLSGTAADQGRLDIGRSLGAEHTLNVQEDPTILTEKIKVITANEGFDVVLECSGAPSAVDFGITHLCRRGQYSQIGLFGQPILVDFEQISYKEILVTGSFSQKWACWERALRLVEAGKIHLKPLISDIYPLSDWDTAFEQFRRKEGLKILLQPIPERS